MKKGLISTLKWLLIMLLVLIIVATISMQTLKLGKIFGGTDGEIGFMEKEYMINTEFSNVKVNGNVYQLRLPKDIKQNPENIGFFVKKNDKIIDCNGNLEGNAMLIKGDEKGKVCCADQEVAVCIELIEYIGKELEARVKVSSS